MIDLLSPEEVLYINNRIIAVEAKEMALSLITQLVEGDYELNDESATVDVFFKINQDFRIYDCSASFNGNHGYQVSLPSGTLNQGLDDVSEHISGVMRVLLGIHIDCEYLDRLSKG